MRVPVTAATRRKLALRAKAEGTTQARIAADAVRDAASRPPSEMPAEFRGMNVAQAMAKIGTLGAGTGGPSDLSTNPKHMEGFGRA